MKLTEVFASILGLTARVEKLEKPEQSTDKPEGEQTTDKPEGETEDKPEGEQATDKPEDKPEGEITVEGATEALQTMETQLSTLEQNFEQNLTAHKTKLDAEFDSRVQAEAAKLHTDAVASNSSPPLKKGPPTKEDQSALAGLTGRARTTAAIAAQRQGK